MDLQGMAARPPLTCRWWSSGRVRSRLHRARRPRRHAGPGGHRSREPRPAAVHLRDERPREGRCCRHRALLANVANVAAVETPSVRSDDVVLLVLPLSSTASTAPSPRSRTRPPRRCWSSVSTPRQPSTSSGPWGHQHPGAPPCSSLGAEPGSREAFASVRMLFTGSAR